MSSTPSSRRKQAGPFVTPGLIFPRGTPLIQTRRDPHSYPNDPLGYVKDILRATPTPDQQEILRHLLIPPCKVIVPSAHDVGKTFIAAAALNWWYDSFDPGA